MGGEKGREREEGKKEEGKRIYTCSTEGNK